MTLFRSVMLCFVLLTQRLPNIPQIHDDLNRIGYNI
jgi:hypothetical protein